MVKINDNFYVDADDHQFIIREKKLVKDKESENFGKEFWENLGYFKNLDSALEYLEKVMLRRKIATKDMSFKQVITEMRKIHKEIKKVFEEE